MSKRKGRRQPQTSEIKSVLRAPPESELEGEGEIEGEGEGEAEGAAVASNAGGDADALEIDDELDRLDAEAVADNGAEQPGAGSDAPARRDPEPSETPVPAEKRPRRLRAVRARETQVTSSNRADHGNQGAAGLKGTAEGDPVAAARWGDDGGPASDLEHEQVEADAAGAESASDDDDGDGGASFAPAFTFDGSEGDDTEGFLRGLLEALLFTSQKPLDLKDLARSAGIDKPRARELIEQLQRNYEGHGLCIEEVAGGFVMRSSPRYAPYIQKILALRPVRLSRAQLETLAIVAYRQPVTKPEVDDIRGVDSGQVIKGLLERALLKMLGKKDEPGRPTLYGTTNDFLELLNLQSLKDLPTLREYTELSEESQRKFLEETGEAAPSEALTFERPPARAAEESGMAAESAGDERGAEGPAVSNEDSAPAATQWRAEDDVISTAPRAEGDADDEGSGPSDESVAPSVASEDDHASTEPDDGDGQDEERTEPSDDDGDDEPMRASANGETLNGSDSDHETPESSELEAEAPESESEKDVEESDDDDDDESDDDDDDDDADDDESDDDDDVEPKEDVDDDDDDESSDDDDDEADDDDDEEDDEDEDDDDVEPKVDADK